MLNEMWRRFRASIEREPTVYVLELTEEELLTLYYDAGDNGEGPWPWASNRMRVTAPTAEARASYKRKVTAHVEQSLGL
jgi:hypothetical protein